MHPMTDMPNIIGIDQSISNTCIHFSLGKAHIKTKKDKFENDLARLDYIRGSFSSFIRPIDAGVAYIEGYAFSRQMAHALGELGCIYKLILYRAGWKIVVVPPNVLKKFVTRRGNAEKSHMMMFVKKWWDYEASDDNDADAFALRAFGVMHYCYQNLKQPPAPFEPANKGEAECFAKVQTFEPLRVNSTP